MTRFLPAALAVLLAACSSGEFRPATGAAGLAPYRGEVRVLERMPAPGTFRRLGVVSAEGGEFTSRGMLLRRLRGEAAARGANAIVVQKPAANPAHFEGKKPRLAAWALRL